MVNMIGKGNKADSLMNWSTTTRRRLILLKLGLHESYDIIFVII